MVFTADENNFLEAYKMFNRTEKEVDGDVDIIRNWLQTQHHLPEILGKKKIRNFLIKNKFSIEKTKQKIDMYYTVRSQIPDWFNNSNPKLPQFKNLSKTSVLAPHPKLLDGKYRVFFMSTTQPGKFEVFDYLKFFVNTFEIRLEEDCMLGEIIIFDFANFSFEDAMKITPTLVAKYAAIYQNVYSLSMKAAYYLNSPSFIDKILSVMKMFLKPKIFDRIHVCTDESILKKVLPEDMIPKEYGGNGLSIQEMTSLLDKKFVEYEQRFDELDVLRVDEKLRPEKLENDDFLGFHGNFKQLSLD